MQPHLRRALGTPTRAPLFAGCLLAVACGDLPDGPRGFSDGAAGGSGGATEYSAQAEASSGDADAGPDANESESESDPSPGSGGGSGGPSEPAESGSSTGAADVGVSGTSGDGLRCGDGSRDPDEACDDGNTVAHDGCEADCTQTIGVERFATGQSHTCALSYAGELRCFGENVSGQLGYGNSRNIGLVETPWEWGTSVDVPDTIVEIALGGRHTCARTNRGEVYCWGANDRGQLGNGTRSDYGAAPFETPGAMPPVEVGAVALRIAAGSDHTCALVAGGIRCWGAGASGQLGQGGGFDADAAAGDLPFERPADLPFVEWANGSSSRTIFAAGDNTCTLDFAGALQCWGDGEFGQLGLGATADVGVDQLPKHAGPVRVSSPLLSLSMGPRHTCAVTTLGRTICWGRGGEGQLGIGSANDVGDDEDEILSDVDVGAPVRSVAVGLDFSCALTQAGAVRCWGLGDQGQRGTGDQASVGANEPPAVSTAFRDVGIELPVTSVAGGRGHVCARTADARLRCWGRGAEGQLGQGNGATLGDEPAELPLPAVQIFQGA